MLKRFGLVVDRALNAPQKSGKPGACRRLSLTGPGYRKPFVLVSARGYSFQVRRLGGVLAVHYSNFGFWLSSHRNHWSFLNLLKGDCHTRFSTHWVATHCNTADLRNFLNRTDQRAAICVRFENAMNLAARVLP